MAVPTDRRLNRNNAESVRQKIQVIKLIKRLQDHALGKIDMTKTQVQAASFLVNKITPNPPEQKDLHLSGEIGHRLIING
jgi:hypothetical protein